MKRMPLERYSWGLIPGRARPKNVELVFTTLVPLENVFSEIFHFLSDKGA